MNTHKILVSGLMLICVLLAACAPATTLIAPSNTSTSIPPTIAPTTAVPPAAGPMTPVSSEVIAEWKMDAPMTPVFGFDSVWVSSHYSGVTSRIDPNTNKITTVIKDTQQQSRDTLVTSDSVWISGLGDKLSRIDPGTNTAALVDGTQGVHEEIAYGFDSIWGSTRDAKLDRIDPATNTIIASIKLGDATYVDCLNDVFVSAQAVWVNYCDKAELVMIDPNSNSIVSSTSYSKLITRAKTQTKVPVGKGADFVWVSTFENPESGSSSGLLRIDPNTGNALSFLPLTPDQVGEGWLAVSDGSVWLGGFSQLVKVDIATNQVVATYTTHDKSGTKIGLGFGSVWVSYVSGLVQRLNIAP